MIIVSSASVKQCPELAIQSSLAKKASIFRQKTAEQEAVVVSLEPVIQSSLTKKAVIEARKAAAVTQIVMEQEVVAVEKTAKQAVKPEACVKDIDFFDSTMMMNLSELHLSVNCASFLQNLDEQAVKYQESSVLKALQTSLRGSALV